MKINLPMPNAYFPILLALDRTMSNSLLEDVLERLFLLVGRRHLGIDAYNNVLINFDLDGIQSSNLMDLKQLLLRWLLTLKIPFRIDPNLFSSFVLIFQWKDDFNKKIFL